MITDNQADFAGTTHEKRKIKYIRISNKISDDVTRTKPVLWIDGGTIRILTTIVTREISL